jgi:hypothetical protein
MDYVVKFWQIWSIERAIHLDTSLTHMFPKTKSTKKMNKLGTFVKNVIKKSTIVF